ncbi:MAG: protein-export chaperone SecB [Bacteroidales bacterium]|nr:protein-export chaperone SecB [Bacteroidales bacterium]
MEKQVKTAKFQFTNFLIRKATINIKSGKIGDEISFAFKPSGTINKTEKKFELVLNVEIKDENKQLEISVSAIGFFIFHPDTDTNDLNNYFYVNAPAILFPYLRAYIASLTALSGITTVTMPTLNMQSLGQDLKSNTKTI